MTGHFLDIGMCSIHGIQFLTQGNIFLGVGESHFAAITFIVVKTFEGVVVFELEVAVVEFLKSGDRLLVIADHVGVRKDGTLDIFGQFLARDDFDV